MRHEDARVVSERSRSSRLVTINRVIGIVATLMSILGVGVIGILSQLAKVFTDPWQAATVAAGLLLAISLIYIIASWLVYRRVVKIQLAEEVVGWDALIERGKGYIRDASETFDYMAGDFSSVREISEAIIAARNKNVDVRILGQRSSVPTVRQNFEYARSLGCDVRVYHEGIRRVRAAIIDAGTPMSQGKVLFVRRRSRSESQNAAPQAGPGSNDEYEYLGTIYSDPMVVTAVGQLFEILWSMSNPYP